MDVKWWFLIPALALALVQTTIIDFNFLLVLVLVLALANLEAESVLVGFAGGLLTDISAGTNLGVGSLVCLGCVLIVFVYKNRFQKGNFFYWLGLFFAANTIADIAIKGNFDLRLSALTAGVGLVLYFFISKLGVFDTQEGIKLRV